MLSNMINCGRFAFSTPADRKGGSLISSLGRGVLVCVVAGRGVVFDACRLNPSLHKVPRYRKRPACGLPRGGNRTASPYHFARSYCTGHLTSCPSSCAARSGKCGSRRNSRAMITISACPVWMISSACLASVISPTAPVSILVCFLMASANSTW
jgi:hypothetical protein